MENKIILSGSGGQGIMLMGKMLAEAALVEGKNVTCLPAYGAEVRGGTANCTVVISDDEIGSPYASTVDVLLAMNEPSMARFSSKVKNGGTIIANSSLVEDGRGGVMFPFTRLAIGIGSPKTANMVALGCLAGKTGVVSVGSILLALERFPFKPDLREMNKKAVQAGAALAADK